MSDRSWIMAITAVLAASATGLAFPPNAAAAEPSEPDAVFVDCSRSGSGGSGSRLDPFSSLAQVNALTLAPGTSVRLKRGSTCTGTLAPHGSGTPQQPITIASYGEPAAPKARIDAGGATEAVLLRNLAHIEVRDLELTAPGDNTSTRRGVYVFAEDAGTVAGIVLRRLDVHDVQGILNGPRTANGKFGNASGGIVVEAAGSTVPTSFTGLRILDNRIWHVDREGIYTWSNWCNRPELGGFWTGLCTAPWHPSTGMVVRGNILTDIGGDGIAVKMNTDALVERNSLDGYNMRSGTYNAGMWTANSERVTFQHNVGAHGRTTLDGMAWDIDHATRDIVFQYNLSHDNEGGWLLLCPTSTGIRDFVVRYNISINDRHRGVENCSGHVESGLVHNNTIYVGDGVNQVVVNENNTQPRNVRFADNLVARTGTGRASYRLMSGRFAFDHNLFYGLPAPANATDTITEDPRLRSPGGVDPAGYRLRADSPAVGAGAVIPDNGGYDFFGNHLPVTQPPAIGAHQPDCASYLCHDTHDGSS
ncbi:right-handed parallel beta-helix repeat-containing protein [Micromonospora sp. NPDC050200]|uniref:right-handed parallel beta-helix repeat-containing protein n=1 Tax=Micromonospora sp. NPDC050200 TaxID=3155664 RepID=UPI0033E4308B